MNFRCRVLSLGRRHLVLLRYGPGGMASTALELAMGLRLASRLDATLCVVGPASEAAAGLSELAPPGVRITVVDGWRGALVEWAFLRSGRSAQTDYDAPLHVLGERAVESLRSFAGAVRRAHRKVSRALLRALKAGRDGGAPATAASVNAPAGAAPKTKKRKAPRLYTPPYYRRLWLDQAPRLAIPGNRAAELQSRLEGEAGIAPGARLVVVAGESAAGGRLGDGADAFETSEGCKAVVEHLRELGFAVVHLGDPQSATTVCGGMTRLPASLSRCDLLQPYCIARAGFLVAATPEGAELGLAFGTPVLTFNAFDPIAAFPVGERDIFTLRHVRAKQDGHHLSLHEMLADGYLDDPFDSERYEHVGNSPEEMLAAVQDMLRVVDGDVPSETPEQRDFRLLATQAGMRRCLGADPAVARGPHHTYLGRGRLAASFARKLLTPRRNLDA